MVSAFPCLTALVQTCAATLGMALVFGTDIPGAGIAACMEHRDIFPAGRGAAAGLADLRDFFRIGVLCTAVRMLGQEYAIQKRKEVRQ